MGAGEALLTTGILGGMAYVAYKHLESQQQSDTAQPVAYTVTTKRDLGGVAKNAFLGSIGASLVESNGGAGGGLLDLIFGGKRGNAGSTKPTTTPVINKIETPYVNQRKHTVGNIGPLLALIRHHESRGNYNAYYTGVSAPPPRNLTTMDVGEVLAWQDRIDRTSPSEAAGAYQVLEDTLRGLVSKGKVFVSQTFNSATQDDIAEALLERRGLHEYRSGQISAEKFANNIAKEWASFPVVTAINGKRPGQSYYAGDGLNKAGVTVAQSLSAVRQV